MRTLPIPVSLLSARCADEPMERTPQGIAMPEGSMVLLPEPDELKRSLGLDAVSVFVSTVGYIGVENITFVGADKWARRDAPGAIWFEQR
jgi:hypothetical protein